MSQCVFLTLFGQSRSLNLQQIGIQSLCLPVAGGMSDCPWQYALYGRTASGGSAFGWSYCTWDIFWYNGRGMYWIKIDSFSPLKFIPHISRNHLWPIRYRFGITGDVYLDGGSSLRGTSLWTMTVFINALLHSNVKFRHAGIHLR